MQLPLVDPAYGDSDSDQLQLPELGRPHVAPDGNVWVTPRLGTWGDQLVCDAGVGGAARFDGLRWDRYLVDHCVESMDIAADGSVWLLASEAGSAYPVLRLYVITPEAVAAAQ